MFLIYLNGSFVSVNKRYLESLTPGVLKARGGFETFVVDGQTIIDYDRHFLRLQKTLQLLKITSPQAILKFKENIFKLCCKNKFKRTVVRLMVWQDKRKVQYAIVCRSVSNCLGGGLNQEVKLMVSNIVRRQTQFTHVKTLDYRCFFEALKEAEGKNMNDALLLNSKGFVVESARANIFFVKKQRLFTPSVQSGCLNGITRQRVLQLSREIGILSKIGLFKIEDLRKADEIFLTNSVRGVIPVCVFENKIWKQPQERKITAQLKKAYEDCS